MVSIDSIINRLEAIFDQYRSGVVAFSGGVDSSVVLAIASRRLKEKVHAVTIKSEFVTKTSIADATQISSFLGVKHSIIDISILDIQTIGNNPKDRCFHCKKEILSKIELYKKENYLEVIFDGSELSDRKEYRPGKQALQLFGVISPLDEVGLKKETVREIARELKLPNWNKPSGPCLATRFPYNTRLSSDLLAKVNQSEEFLFSLGYREFRVRDMGSYARLELSANDLAKINHHQEKQKISFQLKQLGYERVLLDLDEFRSGSMDRDAGIVRPGSRDSEHERERDLPNMNIGIANLDTHRALRTGFPEVIYCRHKSVSQITQIVESMLRKTDFLLLTGVSLKAHAAISTIQKNAEYFPEARITRIGVWKKKIASKPIAIITAGTSDIPVASEAIVTAESFGHKTISFFDIGVAGIHRLFEQINAINQAGVIIVIAGMDGALPSVVAGLTTKPVIAVPTSVGYGASFGGVAALLSMLNACAPGISVVNIDNGFGAGMLAARINSIYDICNESCNEGHGDRDETSSL